MASRSIARTDALPWRAWLRLSAIALLLLVLVPLHLLWRALRLRSPWPRRFLGGAGRLAGLRVRTVGPVPPPQSLLIANHLSWLDILALAGATNTAFVAKAEMINWPLLGWLCKLNDTVFVNREDRGSAAAQAAQVRNALGCGKPLTIFCEGTTGDGVTLLAFRSSLLAAVAPPPPGTVVQPVALEYTDAPAIAWVDDEPIGANALRVLSRPGRLPVTLHYLAPLPPAGRKTMTAEARAAIAGALGQA